ncbi:MAG TPA: FHA domain-containing protein [bacterium]|nr:FHA domain-containing protein [bacterium]HQI50216.1 FHA domain-containing protein [bacterium]HQJ65654.1 FHA domain-containing protein [bacterium]
MPAKLVEMTGARRLFVLTAAETTIGRSHANDIVLPDMKVSKRHARIIQRSKGFYLEDAGSTNGTYLGNTSIKLVHLRSYDTFRIGASEFQFFESTASHPIVLPPQYTPPSTANVPLPASAKPTIRSPYLYPLLIGGGVFVFVLLMIFFLPFYAVQSGQITTCKICNKEVTNTVTSHHVSFLEKNNYSVTHDQGYCESCGMVQVPYTVSLHCKECGTVYGREQHSAPRREEKRDEDRTEGFCSYKCEIIYNIKDATDRFKEGFNPLDLIP